MLQLQGASRLKPIEVKKNYIIKAEIFEIGYLTTCDFFS